MQVEVADPRIAAWRRLCDALEHEPGVAQLSALACGIFAAVAVGISTTSREFSRDFGIAHALVLREIGVLSDECGLITITRSDEKTQRRFIALSPQGEDLANRLLPA